MLITICFGGKIHIFVLQYNDKKKIECHFGNFLLKICHCKATFYHQNIFKNELLRYGRCFGLIVKLTHTFSFQWSQARLIHRFYGQLLCWYWKGQLGFFLVDQLLGLFLATSDKLDIILP